MELDDYLQGFDELAPAQEDIVLNLYAILGYLIGSKQWIAAKTIQVAINDVRNNLATEVARLPTIEDEIPF